MALDSAEKQRRYRERRKAGMPPARYRRHLDRRSKPQRWRDAVEVLLTLQADYREWFDNLPENLLVTSLGEKTPGHRRTRSRAGAGHRSTTRIRA